MAASDLFLTPEKARGHHRRMDNFRISPRPRNTRWTLASDALAFPLWYLTIEHAVSYAQECRDQGGCKPSEKMVD